MPRQVTLTPVITWCWLPESLSNMRFASAKSRGFSNTC
ncbi:Uncharacterised protein [Vibrio cholerae]|nr:Uncharacterised protein [Vibrio cholerae]